MPSPYTNQKESDPSDPSLSGWVSNLSGGLSLLILPFGIPLHTVWCCPFCRTMTAITAIVQMNELCLYFCLETQMPTKRYNRRIPFLLKSLQLDLDVGYSSPDFRFLVAMPSISGFFLFSKDGQGAGIFPKQ